MIMQSVSKDRKATMKLVRHGPGATNQIPPVKPQAELMS
jgi:hypothetical protein